MTHLVHDLRYGLRGLTRRPAFTAFAVLALALGIGATTAIFSLVDALLLRPPVAAEPERLVNVHAVSRDGSGFHAFSYLDVRDYREDNPSFDELAAWSLAMVSVSSGGTGSGPAEEPRVAVGQIVSENYFDVFGIRPEAGRFFLPEEGEGLGKHPVAVVGHGLWQRLGGDTSIIGETLHVNNRPLTIAGVAPEGFTGAFGGVATDVWVPLTLQPLVQPGADLENRRYVWLEMVGRLAPGVSRSEAAAFLDARYRHVTGASGDRTPEGGLELGEVGTVPGHLRGGVRIFLAILMAVVALLLAVTCVNVAGMLVARAAERRREIAVRLALGAGRARLVRQLITESLLLFALGGAAGIWVAHGAAGLFLAVELPVPVPLDLDLGVDLRVFGFALLVTLLSGLVFGLAPALQTTRTDLVTSLSEGATGGGMRRARLRRALLVAQVAVACLLLVATGLFLKALGRAAGTDPGFDAGNVHLAMLDLSLHGYSETAGEAFFRELRERVAALPGVEAASYARVVPLGLGNSTTGFNVPGHDPPPDDVSHPADFNTVDVEYFRTMGIALLAGREFLPSDRAGSVPVAIVNATLAERFWPGQNPIGRTLVLDAGDASRVEVVGVARDGKYRTLGEAPRFYVYLPLAQRYSPSLTLHVRSRGDVSVAPAVRAEIRALDPHLPVAGDMPLAEYVRVSLLPQRVASAVSAILGCVALLLVGIGVYGVTAHSVGQRTRELGLRMALGALPRDVVVLVLRQGATLALAGGVLGLAAASLATRGLRSVLYGVSATDPWVFAGVGAVLVGIVLAGCFFPARRAARIDPLKALRYE